MHCVGIPCDKGELRDDELPLIIADGLVDFIRGFLEIPRDLAVR